MGGVEPAWVLPEDLEGAVGKREAGCRCQPIFSPQTLFSPQPPSSTCPLPAGRFTHGVPSEVWDFSRGRPLEGQICWPNRPQAPPQLASLSTWP